MIQIEWKDSIRALRFGDLKQGDTFEYEGKFFIKVSYNDSEVGAVWLFNGHGHHFDADVLVTPVKIKAYAEEV